MLFRFIAKKASTFLLHALRGDGLEINVRVTRWAVHAIVNAAIVNYAQVDLVDFPNLDAENTDGRES
ncbi:hypothetical protein [Streptomyces cyaneofuscatus]